MLTAENVTINYGDRTVVSGVSLSLRPRQMTSIIGPNGAGKSSLLRAFNGYVQLAKGIVTLDEKPLAYYDRRTVAQKIAVVAQESELRFPVTVFEFVLGGRFAWSNSNAFGWESGEDIQIVNGVLEETSLNELSSRLVNELSGGERQRVVLARALATKADHYLLDEPTTNLDLEHQETLLRLIRKRCDEQNASALVITHDLNLVAQFADEVLVLQKGKKLLSGSPREVLTTEVLQNVFNVRVLVDDHPVAGGLRVTPVFETARRN